MIVRASKKCQIVIPVEIRRRMGIEPGEYFRLEESDGHIVLRPLGQDPVQACLGMFADGGSLTQEWLKEKAAERALEERKAARWLK